MITIGMSLLDSQGLSIFCNTQMLSYLNCQYDDQFQSVFKGIRISGKSYEEDEQVLVMSND